jgi:hypothetical protein
VVIVRHSNRRRDSRNRIVRILVKLFPSMTLAHFDRLNRSLRLDCAIRRQVSL